MWSDHKCESGPAIEGYAWQWVKFRHPKQKRILSFSFTLSKRLPFLLTAVVFRADFLSPGRSGYSGVDSRSWVKTIYRVIFLSGLKICLEHLFRYFCILLLALPNTWIHLLQILACINFGLTLIQGNRFHLSVLAVQCDRTLGQSVFVTRVVMKNPLASSSSLYAASSTSWGRICGVTDLDLAMEKHKRVVADVLESFKAPALRLAVGAVMELKCVIIVDRAPA